MKNFRKSLVALALVAGVTGAIAGNVSGSSNQREVNYNWTHYDTDGTTVLESNVVKTPADAERDFGCKDGITRCAVGTSQNQPDITLRYPN